MHIVNNPGQKGHLLPYPLLIFWPLSDWTLKNRHIHYSNTSADNFLRISSYFAIPTEGNIN